MDEQIKRFMQKTPPFHLLSMENIEEIIAYSYLRKYSKHAIIIHQGDRKSNYVFVIIDGIAINTITNDAQEEITVKTYRSGDVFGLTQAMSGEGFMYSTKAMSEVTSLLIPINVFEKMMTSHIAFTEEVVRIISFRLREVYKQFGSETSLQIQGPSVQPYRKKVVELMSHPIVTCSKDNQITEVSDKLINNHVSSLVVIDNSGVPVGIVTKKDLIKAYTRLGKDKDICNSVVTAKEIMNTPLITIEPQSFYYEALHYMVKHNIKHLPVIEDGRAIGLVTPRNLISSFSDSTLYLVSEIENETTIEGLAKIIKEVDTILKRMLREHATSQEICAMVTEFNDRITKKIIYLAEQEMIIEGYGQVPVSYCWISLGSEGRKEQTLQTDQDNAIIFADVPIEQYPEIDQYFGRLAEKVVSGLIQCGFPKCPGDVMATNKQWRNTVSGWQKKLQDWINDSDLESIRLFTIFADFRPLYGDKSLGEDLRRFILKESRKPMKLFHLMAEDDAEMDIAINRLGEFQLEKEEHEGQLDLKKGGILHLVNGLRILAFKHGISEVNSWERLEALFQLEVFSGDERDQVMEALDDLMMLRIQTNLQKLEKKEKPDHYVNPKKLSKRDRLKLKNALLTTRWFQLMTSFQSKDDEFYHRGYMM